MTVLDPDTKMSHFKKHWDKDLQAKVLESSKEIVCDTTNSDHSVLFIFCSSKNVTLSCMELTVPKELLSRKVIKTGSSIGRGFKR